MPTTPRSDGFQISFQPSGRSVRVAGGTSLLNAATSAGFALRSPCGGKGTCGKCRVRILQDTASGGARQEPFTQEDWDSGWRLACRTTIESDIRIEIPPDALESEGQRILLSTDGSRPFHLSPAVQMQPMSLDPPTREQDQADTERIARAIGRPLNIPLPVLRSLPGILRQSGWQTSLVHSGPDVLEVLPSPAKAPLGVAFDLGTTTIVGTLYDLSTGQELGVASALNGQIPLGDDVLARIEKARTDESTRWTMQATAVNSLNRILESLCEQVGCSADRVYDLTLAGNTAMQQLLCGIDPSPLGEIPFTPAFSTALSVDAKELGLFCHPQARMFVFPQIGGFVGGDTVAGILATELDRIEKPTLLIDIGTNGEIVLALPGGRLLCTSTAAGPAFEGARISQGMRAMGGAIDTVVFRDGHLSISVIGGGTPVGLCGTALIDAAAELLRQGILDSTGHILLPEEIPPGMPESLRNRVRVEGDNAAFVLAAPSGSNHPLIRLTQRDIRELQLASGAIRAGAETLLARAGLDAGDLDAVLLAGAFGNYIRKTNALRIGLLPAVEEDRVRFIGNAASHGARMALLSTEERLRAEHIRTVAEHIDLGADPGFQMAFGMAMLFPEEG